MTFAKTNKFRLLNIIVNLKAKKRLLFLLLIMFIFYLILFPSFQRNIFNLAFDDEKDTFVTGQFVSDGLKIHKDIYYQHQPIPTLITAATHKIFKFNSSFLLIKRHRELIFFYTSIAFILLVWRFGLTALLSAVVYELTKFNFWGNLYFAEALVVPPLLYVTGSLIEFQFSDRKRITKIELFLLLASLVFIQFTLLPLWPFVAGSLILIWLKLNPESRKLFIKMIAAMTTFSFLIFVNYFDIYGYIHDTMFVTLTQVVPQEQNFPLYVQIWRIFFFPFRALLLDNSGIQLIVKIISFTLLINLFLLIASKKYKTAGIIFVLVSLLNFRPEEFKQGSNIFHLIPLYSGLIWITFQTTVNVLNKGYLIFLKPVFIFIIIFVAVFFSYMELFLDVDKNAMWYQNYSIERDIGQAIKNLSTNEHTLLAVPAGPLIYWESGLKPSTPYFNTYVYMKKSRFLSTDATETFEDNPPSFLVYYYGDFQESLYGKTIIDKYVRIPNSRGISNLFIRKDVLSEIPKEKWDKVAFFGYAQPK